MSDQKGEAPEGATSEAPDETIRVSFASTENDRAPGARGAIEFYAGSGVALEGLRMKGRAGPGGKRGKIKGWSTSSRRRMRDYLLTHRPRHDCVAVGTTYTVPGPNMGPEAMRSMWDMWCRDARRKGWSAIWRLEVQQRGQVHWHCLVFIPRASLEWMDLAGGVPGQVLAGTRYLPDRHGGKPCITSTRIPPLGECTADTLPGVPERVVEGWHAFAGCRKAMELWHSVLERTGPFTYGPSIKLSSGRRIRRVDSLMDWPGARDYSAFASVDDGRGAWKRYLQDHCTKAKQEQIAEGFGRHWGVIGRQHMERILPDSVLELPREQFARFLRAYQRLATPQLKDKRPGGKRSRFGRRLGRRIRRGSWGRSVWFSEPETVLRLAEWARST